MNTTQKHINELIEDAEKICASDWFISTGNASFDDKRLRELLDYISELEARLDKAVELPCKVGDTIYNATMDKYMIIEDYSLSRSSDFKYFYFHCRCAEHDKSSRKGERYVINVCSKCAFGDKCFQGFGLSDFGKTVFFTREEAKKALKEKVNNDEFNR